MKKTIQISIPEPCYEDWDKMSPREKGRHCKSCNKTVIDYTSQSDEQIVKSVTSSEKICGRFKATQLNREMVLARKDKNNYLSLVASSALAIMTLGSQDIHAQGNPKTVRVDSLKTPKVKGKIAKSILKEKVVSGMVITADDGLPLPGASVIVKGTTKDVKTDFDGNFKIETKIGDTLIFRYLGMKEEEIVISNSSKINVGLKLSVYMDEVVLGYPSKSYMASLRRKSKRKAKRDAIKNGETERTLIGKFFYGIKSLFSKK